MKKYILHISALSLLLLAFMTLAGCNRFRGPGVEFIVDGKTYHTEATTGGFRIPLPKAPVKEGFVFEGWFTDKGEWNEPFTSTSLIKTELTSVLKVYARWDHYEISSARQLRNLDLDEDYVLTKDINLWGMEWTPIGNQTTPFTGTFDGNGHKISNFKIWYRLRLQKIKS